MEKVTVKIELEREDISTLMFLAGGKLSEEQWNKLKGTEYTVEDDDLEGQAIQLIAMRKEMEERGQSW